MFNKKPIIAFIGAGNMGSSLIGGLIADQYPADHIWGTNPTLEQLASLKKDFGIHVTQNNLEAAEHADILVFAVKPGVLKTVLTELRELIIRKKPLLISIVTGVKIDSMLSWLGQTSLAIVRGMPNTPCLVRAGVTGLFANQFVSQEQKQIAESILRSVSVVIWFQKESDLDVVTAVSGSGPAYIFLMMELMQEAGIKLGLDAKTAELLTVQTTLGAAKMALEIDQDLAVLRKQVTSPGGTTEQALKIFEAGHMKELFFDAIRAAYKKATELAEMVK